LLMLDQDTRRVYRLFDLTKRLRLTPGCAYCMAGKVNSANTLYLVIESVKLDTKHQRSSTTPVPADGAGGLACADPLVDSQLDSTAGARLPRSWSMHQCLPSSKPVAETASKPVKSPLS
jgi:hypothetical protein